MKYVYATRGARATHQGSQVLSRGAEVARVVPNAYFWERLERALTGVRRIFISPDGILNQVSFAALRSSDGRLLIDRYETIHVFSSTRNLLRTVGAAVANTAVLIGDPQFNVDVTGGGAGLHPVSAGTLAARDTGAALQEGSL